MTDQIQIKDLRLRTIIGINDEERRILQEVLINLTLFVDTRRAGVSDDIADAVWDEPHSGHETAGSLSDVIRKILHRAR